MILYTTEYGSRVYHEVDFPVDALSEYEGELDNLISELTHLTTRCGTYISYSHPCECGYGEGGYHGSVYTHANRMSGVPKKRLCKKCERANTKGAFEEADE